MELNTIISTHVTCSPHWRPSLSEVSILQARSTARLGYEEAASQGIVAGINAGLAAQGKAPFTLSRAESYIGVLIDDLITKGVSEPYRMFTSRSEYRMSCRADNADIRLTTKGRAAGVVSDKRWEHFQSTTTAMGELQSLLEGIKLSSQGWQSHNFQIHEGQQIAHRIRHAPTCRGGCGQCSIPPG